MTHKTKGIVLKTIKYGDTSLIATIYTELFGVQSYMVKGVRQSSKKSGSKSIYFQPGAILDMVVYHNQFKNLNFIKEYQWGYLYQNVLFDVIKNTVAMYVVEVVQHTLKEPEANPELYYLVQDTLTQLDKGTASLAANLPLYFTLQLAGELGFKIQGTFTNSSPVLDLQEGQFISVKNDHGHYIDGELAQLTSRLLNINFYSDLEEIPLNRNLRRELLNTYQNYMALHIPNYGVIKTISVLQEIFN